VLSSRHRPTIELFAWLDRASPTHARLTSGSVTLDTAPAAISRIAVGVYLATVLGVPVAIRATGDTLALAHAVDTYADLRLRIIETSLDDRVLA